MQLMGGDLIYFLMISKNCRGENMERSSILIIITPTKVHE